MRKKNYLILLCICFLFFSCKNQNKPIEENVNVLPSFNESSSKTAFLDFVKKVTDVKNADYVEPQNRIACIDNDGTLWVESPLPNQIYFEFDRIKQLAPNHPEWNQKMPFKAVISDDIEAINKFTPEDIFTLTGVANSEEDVENFSKTVHNWIDTAMHPVLHKKYTDLVFQPMLEIMDYLRSNDFTIYIVSGGSQEFMRPWTKETYGIPAENVIGSTFKRRPVINGDSIYVAQTAELEHFDDHEGKVVSINKYIGRKPIMVLGNSDGDLEMMEYTTTDNPLPTFCLFVDHDDEEREFHYNENTVSGKLEKGRIEATKKGWTIVSMKNDWNKIFAE